MSTQPQRRGLTSSFLGFSSCVLLFLLAVFPMVLKLLYVKAFIFAVVLVAVVLEYLIEGFSRLSLRIAVWTVGLALLSSIFVLEGLLRETPGAMKVALVYVLWPLVYLLWIAGLAQRRHILGVEHTLLVAAWFIGLYGCAFLLTELKLIPETRLMSALSMDWEFESFGSQPGYTGMAFPGLNSLPFLLPYLMARLATQGPDERRKRSMQVALWGAIILCSVVTFAASRRALLLVVMLTPVFVWGLRFLQPAKEKTLSRCAFKYFVVAFVVGSFAVFIGLGAIYQFEFTSFWGRFSSAFDFSAVSTDELGGGAVRREQFIALIRGWLDYPLFGAGHGASAAVYGSIRSYDLPWAYELSYFALLYQIGLVGLGAYAAGVIWIFRRGTNAIRQGGEIGRLLLPMMVGLIGVLMCHFADPYLDRFDGMWMFFVPLAAINYWLSRVQVSNRLASAR